MAEPEQRGGEPSTELLAAAFTGLGAGMVLTDRTGHITAVNPAAERILSRLATGLVGADAHDLLHRAPDGSLIPHAECDIQAVLRHGRTSRGNVGMFLDGDGHLVPVDWSAAPIRQHGVVAGVAVLFTDAAERLAAEERQAHHMAALEELTERLTLVTEITTVLTQAVNVEEALHRLVRLLVPRLADWATVILRTGQDELQRVALIPPEGVGGARRWTGPLPPVPEASPYLLARVLRGGDAALLGSEEIGAPSDSPLEEAQKELFREYGTVSAIIAPLRAPRQVLGALTVARTDPSHPFDTAELMLLADIGRRAGLAVDNVRLFSQQRDIAATMQRHLLTPLPRVDHLRLAARYLPAAEGSQIGGDWYDAFLLADGVTALVIGDVAGHDVPAAAGMAQLRNMLRSLAWDRTEPPSAIVRRLDESVPSVADVPMASLVIARIEGPEGGPWRLHHTNAGHPPPLLITHDGHAQYLEGEPDLLVGTQLDGLPARHDSIGPLPQRSTLLLYTDGLVERADADLDDGLERLRRHGAALAHRPLEEFCDEILTRMKPDGTDDTALLALRMPYAGEGARR